MNRLLRIIGINITGLLFITLILSISFDFRLWWGIKSTLFFILTLLAMALGIFLLLYTPMEFIKKPFTSARFRSFLSSRFTLHIGYITGIVTAVLTIIITFPSIISSNDLRIVGNFVQGQNPLFILDINEHSIENIFKGTAILTWKDTSTKEIIDSTNVEIEQGSFPEHVAIQNLNTIITFYSEVPNKNQLKNNTFEVSIHLGGRTTVSTYFPEHKRFEAYGPTGGMRTVNVFYHDVDYYSKPVIVSTYHPEGFRSIIFHGSNIYFNIIWRFWFVVILYVTNWLARMHGHIYDQSISDIKNQNA